MHPSPLAPCEVVADCQIEECVGKDTMQTLQTATCRVYAAWMCISQINTAVHTGSATGTKRGHDCSRQTQVAG